MHRSHALLTALAAVLVANQTPAQTQQFNSSPRPQPMALATPPQYSVPANVGVLSNTSMQTPVFNTGYPQYVPPASPSVTVNTGGSGGSGGMVMPVGGFGGYMPNSMGYGFAMQGIADYTRASGQYWNDIESARMSQEKVRQEQFNTQRQRLQYEMDYEKLRPTAAKMRNSARRDDLDWARNDPPNTQIWSGDTFNILLQSILRSSAPGAGPYIPLEQNMIQGLNLRDKSTRGNIALAKDDGKFEWPDALMERPFDSIRGEFDRNYSRVLKQLRSGERADRQLIRTLREDLQRMDDRLVQMVADLSPTEFIDARRQIKTLQDTVRGLDSPIAAKAFPQGWRDRIRTVADLVVFCMNNGLEFGPATRPTDFAAYSAAYFPIRNYERAMTGGGGKSSGN